MQAEKLINWRELSRLLTGTPKTVNRTRIGLKHQKKVNELIEAIEKWHQDITR